MMLINGRRQDRLSATDRGLQFGDGVFETMAVDDGRPLCLQRHLDRLALGCSRLAIPVPEPAMLEEECMRVCAGPGRAVLKVVVTRGVGGRGYAPDRHAKTTRIVSRHPWPQYTAGLRSEGASVRICATRLGRNARLAGIKHLNRLEQVLARMESAQAEYDEGLMLDDRESVIEGIASNLFACRDGRLLTPDLSECGVAGIMRELVLEVAPQLTGADAQIGPLGIDDLLSADECFLTNSLIGIWPIKGIERTAMKTGPLSHELQALLTTRGAITSD
jgi:4-amino-4-deoxychorismate lyase